jgi:hypothetical protein
MKSFNFISVVLALIAVNFPFNVLFTQSEEICTNSSTIAKSRMKRYLIFQPGSRILVRTRVCKIIALVRCERHIFFPFSYFSEKIQFRVNVKDNVIKVNQIFAHGFGFRANIDLLQPMRPKHKIRRREVYDTLEELINQHGARNKALTPFGADLKTISSFSFFLQVSMVARAS